MKDKRLTSVVNDFDTFTTTLGEPIASTSNWYKIMVNDMTSHGVVGTPHEYNIKFIDNLEEGRGMLNLVFKVIHL